MASSTKGKEPPLVEEKPAELVPFNGAQEPIQRKGLFLNPTPSNPPTTRPNVAPYAVARGEPKYHPQFRWWADPHPQWDQWVEKLQPKYSPLWQKSGILDAITVSKHRFRRDSAALLAVARFWCKETNSFFFPWAEATVTLEDVMILGGLPVLGEPVRMEEPVRGVVGHMVSKMAVELRRNCPKGRHAPWLQHYLEKGNGDEIEHIAFLSLWLSRFVLVKAYGTAIREAVFQVAVRLALGTRIALAPAVLASIYRDLGAVKEHMCNKSAGVLAVWSPMSIVQMWLWERFPDLRPNARSVPSPDMPRALRWIALRWDVMGKTVGLSSTMAVLMSPDGFRWRPYAVEELMPDDRPFFYMDEGGWFVSDVTKDEELQSFAQCLRACELVGLDCIEQYLPHRVAMQFALDQQVPKSVPRANSSWEVAWKTYDMSSMSVELYVPPRLFESAATIKYTNWWRNIRRRDMDMAAGMKRKAGQNLPKSQQKKVRVFNETELSARLTLRPHEIKTENICSESQEQHACTMQPPHTELSLPLESSEKTNQSLDHTGKIESVSEKQQKHDLASVSDSVYDKGIAEVVEKTSTGELHHDLSATEKSREANEKQQDEEFRPETDPFNEEGITEVVKRIKELHHDLAVTESKAEIEKQRDEESRPEPVSLVEEGIAEVVKKIKELHLNLTTADKLREENEKQRNEESQPEPLCVSDQGVTKCALNTDAGVDNERTAAKKPEAELERAETEEIEERDSVKRKGLDRESKRKREETREIEERDSARWKELEREAKRKREQTTVTQAIEQTDLARKIGLRRESKRQTVKRIVIDPAKELARDQRISQLKQEIASILAQIRYWESVSEVQVLSSASELIPCTP